jgi:kumamolisin
VYFTLLSKVIVNIPRSRNFKGSRPPVLVAIFLTVVSAVPALALSGARYYLNDSIKEIASDPHVHVIRQTLSPSEHNEILQFFISLKMPNFGELEDRIAHGGQIAPDVMAARYLPSASDYAAVESWLKGQGFTLTQEDRNHTNIFASGTVSQIEHSFGVSFARVATADGEFTSAISAPNLPVEFSGAVLAINGLQPHLRMHHHISLKPNITSVSGTQFFAPADILDAYNAPTTLNGAGQTIAIVMGATVLPSDLSSFYSHVGSTATAANFNDILFNGGPTTSSQRNDNAEAALDVEWASGMAPGAQVRLYSIPSLTDASIIAACRQILTDAPAHHITVASLSIGNEESNYTPALAQSDSQVFAQMAAAGITVLVASGDGGSNPDLSAGTYNASAPLEAEYPASDPNVAGVGGTLLTLDTDMFLYGGETVFSTIPSGDVYASGGGISQIFTKPSWQTDGVAGSILTTNANRCVPDVAIVWDSLLQSNNFGIDALVILNGQALAAGGTSLSVQTWAGIAALLNQARANAGLSPIGLLGPAIYPLNGTSAFNDITMGNNGGYFAGPGYDLCTGLGSPNIANLATALAGGSIPSTPSSGGGSSGSAGGSGGASSSAGGGGGAPSYWFYLALAILLAIRKRFGAHNAPCDRSPW